MINTRSQSLNQERTEMRMINLVVRSKEEIKKGVIIEEEMMVNMGTGLKEMGNMINNMKQKVIELEKIVLIIAEEIKIISMMRRDLMKEEADIKIMIEEEKDQHKSLIQKERQRLEKIVQIIGEDI